MTADQLVIADQADEIVRLREANVILREMVQIAIDQQHQTLMRLDRIKQERERRVEEIRAEVLETMLESARE
jgi:hypothetical protein